MRKLKIKFVDFWGGFQPIESAFWRYLTNYFELEYSEQPEIIFYSVFGNEYLNYDCYKIFYTGENVRPNFYECDLAISFDYNKNWRNLRIPLYTRITDLTKLTSKIKNETVYTPKTKFCCMVVSNSECKFRNDFFEKLSEYKKVDSGGRYLNNIGFTVENKIEFIKDYKFVISFENSEYPGYTTEKIVEPMLCGSIPIYWGNPLIEKDFNTSSFVNFYDYNSVEKVIERIIEIDNNDLLFYSIQKMSNFKNDSLMDFQDFDKASKYLSNSVDMVILEKPINKRLIGIIYKKIIKRALKLFTKFKK